MAQNILTSNGDVGSVDNPKRDKAVSADVDFLTYRFRVLRADGASSFERLRDKEGRGSSRGDEDEHLRNRRDVCVLTLRSYILNRLLAKGGDRPLSLSSP